ncbi:MAG: hypothetical protein ACR2PL_19215 [Dehalococcoidia bacterium]
MGGEQVKGDERGMEPLEEILAALAGCVGHGPKDGVRGRPVLGTKGAEHLAMDN